jgi:hypothetical protein
VRTDCKAGCRVAKIVWRDGRERLVRNLATLATAGRNTLATLDVSRATFYRVFR